MKTSKLISAIIITCGLFVMACKEGMKKDPPPVDVHEIINKQPETHGTEVKEGEITLSTPLDQKMVVAGKATYELKCQSCHRLTEDKLVGPGWKNVSKNRKPEWIINMITNVDMMLESDPEAQKLLEQCMVRMPNQNITKDQAREVLEFMRSNDGEK